jgi:Fe-S cluster assembly protein SufD
MKVEILDLESIKETKTLEIMENTFFVIRPNFQQIRQKIILKIIKQDVEINLSLATTIKNKETLEIQIEHLKPNTKSEVQIRTDLDEGANFNFKGNIFVGEEAEDSKGILNIKGLASGNNIAWNVKPNLEINNEEIDVEHKASLLTFNTKQLNYLRSRGLNQEEAIKTLKKSFLWEAVEKIPDIRIKNNIMEELKL